MEGVMNAELAGPPTPGGQTPYPLPNPSGRGYYEYLPEGYGSGTRFPLIVFFHGIGERGNGSLAELPRVLRNGPPKLIESGKEFPAIVISPQTATNWASSITTPFVNYLLANYDVDPDRVYITGLSLGGQGTWDYARANPSSAAAIVPICGPRSGTGYGVLRGLPLWTFHRFGDQTVLLDHTQDILQEITGVRPVPPEPVPSAGETGYFKAPSWSWRAGQAAPAAGENPAFTVYPGTGHDAWTAAYNNQAMWDWLFAQRRPSGDIVFKQDFQSSTSVPTYYNPDSPDIGQFDDIGGHPNGGTFSINQGRLQLVRTGSTATDNDAAITRWTDLAGPPAVLHAAFDVGVSGWTATPYQSGALALSFGRIDDFVPYESGGVAASTFHSITVKGQGVGQFSVSTSGVYSAPLAANGTLHHVDVFLNKSGAAANYRGPDGVVRSLQNNGVALWVNGTAVVLNGAAANGSDSTLTDFRIRWSSPDNGTWVLDNFLFRKALPQ
jgi:dienelactone hydrolase